MPANKRSYGAGQLPAFPVEDAPSAAFGINRPGYVAKRGARIAFGQTRLEMRMLCAFGQFVDSAALFSEFCQCIIHWSACLPSAYKGCDRHWFLPPFHFSALRRVCRLSTFPHYAAFAGFEAEKPTTGVKPEPRNGQISETVFQRLSTDNVCTVRHSKYGNRASIPRSNSHHELITEGSYQAAWRTTA